MASSSATMQQKKAHSYRLVNVFTIGDDCFSGNPLCVFEDGSEFAEAQMKVLTICFVLLFSCLLVEECFLERLAFLALF
jgi:hypothetical protein